MKFSSSRHKLSSNCKKFNTNIPQNIKEWWLIITMEWVDEVFSLHLPVFICLLDFRIRIRTVVYVFLEPRVVESQGSGKIVKIFMFSHFIVFLSTFHSSYYSPKLETVKFYFLYPPRIERSTIPATNESQIRVCHICTGTRRAKLKQNFKIMLNRSKITEILSSNLCLLFHSHMTLTRFKILCQHHFTS